MRKASTLIDHKSSTGIKGKGTSIGRGNLSTSSMPKRKKQTHKPYRGQGKW